jgi:hypothetical protein
MLTDCFKDNGVEVRTQRYCCHPETSGWQRQHIAGKRWYIAVVILASLMFAEFLPIALAAGATHDAYVIYAKLCAGEVSSAFERAEMQGELTMSGIFDHMYIPIPGSSSRQFHTAYDSWADEILVPILKKRLNDNPSVLYIFLTDKNGYIPVAPAIRQIPASVALPVPKGILDTPQDLEAARFSGPELIRWLGQDSQAGIMEITVPILIRNQIWGVIRLGVANAH